MDYNRNGQQDLIVTTEWGAVKLFENNDGKFIDRTSELGFDNYRGLWQGVASGDFNGNGYPDLVVTNWGENSPYIIEDPSNPIKLYYGDFNRNGRIDMIETYYDPVVGGDVPRRKLSEYENIENILRHIRSNEQFSKMTIGEILRTDPEQVLSKEVNTLKHTVFLNRQGSGFDAVPLPAEAQFTAGFYAGVADIDNDGREDIFISQNFFAVADPQRKPRLDAGRGLWLRGNGEGNFEALPGQKSGIKVYGEQRGAALGDYTGDGRVDLAISQNAADTRLFENQADKRGIRITLHGPENNTLAIGSSVRLVYEDGSYGAERSIQAGSGYWSQNSSVQVVGYSEFPAEIEVRWFDGKTDRIDTSENQMDYQISY